MNCVPETSIMREWDSNKPLVSIVSVAYNHGMYIEEAINGFLAQKSTYPFEIVIYDDASTDNTQQIIVTYYKQYPSIIKPILQEENQWLGKGINGTIKFAYPATRGKYIALCEGDDYWTDPYKLQKQVDFLEGNEEYVLCFHPVKILEPDGKLVDDYITKVPPNYEILETMALKGNYIHTPSVVFRNVIHQWPDELNYSPLGDYFLYILLGQFGKYHYLNDKMAIYRNGVGIWSTQQSYEKIWNGLKSLIAIRQANIKNNFVYKILTERIIYLFSDIMNDLDTIRINEIRKIDFMGKAIDELFLYRIKDDYSKRVENISSLKLLKIIIYRFYIKLKF